MNQHHKKLSFSNNFYTLGIFLLFAVVYCLISLGNHYFFRTYALDYGVFNQAVYQFSQLKSNDCTICFTRTHYFSDHFSPITFLLIPIQLLLGSYGLLILQIFIVLFGGLGLYKYMLLRSNKNYLLAQFCLILFLSFTGIFTALSFDFHSNVLATMFVPWVFYFIEKKQFKWVVLFWILILLCKENMGLWMTFLMLGLLFVQNGKHRKLYLWHLLVLASISLIYFFIVFKYIMPAFQGEGEIYGLSRYDVLGNSFSEIVINILSNPIGLLSLVFNFQDPNFFYKTEFFFVSIVFGAWACFVKPAYLLMIIPVLAQKFLTNHVFFWGIYGHYYIDFAPVFIIALFEVMLSWKTRSVFKTTLLLVSVIAGITVTMYILNTTENYILKANAKFWKKSHYSAGWDRNVLIESLEKIPDDAPLSCSNQLGARLYRRADLYLFPKIDNAEFIALMKKGNPYPLTNEQFEEKLTLLRQNASFFVLEENDEIVIFQKLKE